ncbi:hypothetical protein EJB05_26875, partial [Eragrostis curvula]
MDDLAIGILEKLFKIGLEIKKAVETVQQNKEECCEIEERVVIVRAILTHLSEATKNEAMESALEDLYRTLRRALNLIKDCQKKSILCHFCTSGALSKQLCRVRDDITRKIMAVQFATTLQLTLVFTGPNKLGACSPPSKPQDIGKLNITHGDDSTGNVSALEADLTKGQPKVETGHEVSFATLPGLKMFSFSELAAATNNFSDERLIGRGGFSSVYKGVLRAGPVVAVKKFMFNHVHLDTMLLAEVKIGAKLEHKNIVKHLGYCLETTSKIVNFNGQCVAAERPNHFLVLGYLPNGSLDEITQGERRVHWSCCFRIIQGIAQGVHYLHEQRIIHSDLKPSNILFDLDLNPVIIDFGLSKALDPDDEIILDTVLGTMGYMAPEHIYSSRQSLKSDVYAFGVTLLETVTSVATGSNMGRGLKREDWESTLLQAGGLKGLLHPTVLVDESQLLEINRSVEVGLRCTELDPADRPTMADVLQMLNGRTYSTEVTEMEMVQQNKEDGNEIEEQVVRHTNKT